MRRFYGFLLMLVCLIPFNACKKQAGFGGLATVTGKVYAFDYNNSNILEGEGYTGDWNVYIKTTDNPGVLDRVQTDFNGAFRFEGLRKGEYTVWVFEDCDTCTDNKRAIQQSVKIEKNNEEIELSDFKIKI